MIAIVSDADLSELRRNAVQTDRQRVVVVTTAIGATVSQAIVEVLANSTYYDASITESVPNASSESRYSRQREWWNTPKKERRRKK